MHTYVAVAKGKGQEKKKKKKEKTTQFTQSCLAKVRSCVLYVLYLGDQESRYHNRNYTVLKAKTICTVYTLHTGL